MVLKGTATRVFTNNSAFELVLTWTGTQNIAGNSTTISATLTMRSRASWATVSDATASATSITINGNTRTVNVSSTLSGNASKTLMTHSVTVPHNANGSKTVTIGASHYFDIYWNGGNPQTPTLSTNYVLDTIARASTGSGSNFVFTGNSSITISRQSSSFTHEATMTIGGTHVKKITGLGTSGTFSFTDAERKILVTGMKRATSAQVVVSLQTKSGSTNIGSPYTIKYNVTAPAVLSGSIPAFTIGTSGFRINVSNFHTSAGFSFNGRFNWGSFSKNASITSSTPTYPLSQSDVNSMLQAIPNGNRGWGSMVLTSYYHGVAYGSDVTIGSVEGRVNVSANSPTVAGGTTYEDTDSSIVSNVTGNNQLIVQNRSKIRVKIPANLGTARGSATLSKIRVTLGGTSKEINYTASATNIDLGTTNANTNSNLVVTVIDSRGNTGTWTQAVSILPYSVPQLTPLIVRKDGFEDETTIDIRGTYSRMNIGGVDKNAIIAILVRLKKVTDANYGETRKPTNTSSGGKISSPQYTEILDNTHAWDIEIVVHDKLTLSTKSTFRIPEGRPAMFIDKEMKSVGVGMFPSKAKMLQVEGGIEATGNINQSGSVEGRINPIRIPANSHLNNYREPGMYYNPVDAEAKTIGEAGNYAFSLLVEKHAGVKQTLTTYLTNDPFKWYRNYYNGTWGAWFQELRLSSSNGLTIPGNFGVQGSISTSQTVWADSHIASGGNITASGVLKGRVEAGIVTYASGISSYAGNNWLNKTAGVVSCGIALKNANVIAGQDAGTHLMTLPVGFRPKNNMVLVMQTSVTGIFTLQVDQTGKVFLSRHRRVNATGYQELPAGSWINVTLAFVAEN